MADIPHRLTDPDDRPALSAIWVVRVCLFVLITSLALLVSFGLAREPDLTGVPTPFWVTDWWFALLVGLVLTAGIIAIDIFTPKKKLSTISGICLGLLGGLVAALGVSFLIDLVIETYPEQLQGQPVDQIVGAFRVLFGVVLCYLGVAIVLQTQDDFRLVIPYVEFAKEMRGTRPLIMDSSALIDGRMLQVAETGLIQAPLIVPRFVIAELQALGDSSDRTKRARGRRGLEMVTKLQRSPRLDVSVDEAAVPGMNVDQMLVELARRLPGAIVTNDVGLNSVASIHGVVVINMNDVANALKPNVIPGEPLSLRLLKPGEHQGQAVGYLEDGTMVVAENGAEHIGEQVTLVVTSSLQTSAGRLIFGRIDGIGDQHEGPEDRAPRERGPEKAPSDSDGDTPPPSAGAGDVTTPVPSSVSGGGHSARKRAGVRNPRRG